MLCSTGAAGAAHRQRSKSSAIDPNRTGDAHCGSVSNQDLRQASAKCRYESFRFSVIESKLFRARWRLIDRRQSNENNQTSYYRSRARRDGRIIRGRRQTVTRTNARTSINGSRFGGAAIGTIIAITGIVRTSTSASAWATRTVTDTAIRTTAHIRMATVITWPRTTVYASSSINDDATVAAVQRRLARGGYYHGSIDGVIGPATRSRDSLLRAQQRITDRWRYRSPVAPHDGIGLSAKLSLGWRLAGFPRRGPASVFLSAFGTNTTACG